MSKPARISADHSSAGRGDAQWLFAGLRCTADPHSAGYVSTEISSGRRFAHWYAATGRHLDPNSVEYRSQLQTAVIARNIEEGRRRVEQVRARYGGVWIEPLSLEVPHWSQDQYRDFWACVIRELVRCVVMLDGWECSNGAAYEYLTALECRCEIIAEDGSPLPAASGSRVLARGVEEMDRLGAPVDFLRRMLAAVERAAPTRPGRLG
jgi:hypothetical protein